MHESTILQTFAVLGRLAVLVHLAVASRMLDGSTPWSPWPVGSPRVPVEDSPAAAVVDNCAPAVPVEGSPAPAAVGSPAAPAVVGSLAPAPDVVGNLAPAVVGT